MYNEIRALNDRDKNDAINILKVGRALSTMVRGCYSGFGLSSLSDPRIPASLVWEYVKLAILA
jgi:hypothetical protein